jgi:uncharacterized protein
MKTKTLLLFVFLFAAGISAMAQSKKDIENSLNSCTKAKDSIQKAYTRLIAIHDSINKVYQLKNITFLAYDSMYRVIKTKVLLKDFNPKRMPVLLDSLKAARNLEFSTQAITYQDSLSVLKRENTRFKALNDILTVEASDKTKVVNDLKQLKDLLESKIITQEEFDAKKAKLIEKL